MSIDPIEVDYDFNNLTICVAFPESMNGILPYMYNGDGVKLTTDVDTQKVYGISTLLRSYIVNHRGENTHIKKRAR